jgi:hypothetical protein
MGDVRNAYGIWFENLKARDQLRDPNINGRMILKLLLRKWGVWLGSSGSE